MYLGWLQQQLLAYYAQFTAK